MRARTDDEVYRVDQVWLGPPRLTFPWRARYSAYGIGIAVFVALLFTQRQILGIGFGFFTVAWALLLTVVATRWLGRVVDPDRPLGHLLGGFVAEISAPRLRTKADAALLLTGHVQIHEQRPLPRPGGRGRAAARGARR